MRMTVRLPAPSGCMSAPIAGGTRLRMISFEPSRSGATFRQPRAANRGVRDVSRVASGLRLPELQLEDVVAPPRRTRHAERNGAEGSDGGDGHGRRAPTGPATVRPSFAY